MTSTPADDAFRYQLDMLKAEVELVNTTIRQMDDISKSLKEWCITIWAAAVGGALATAELHAYVWATSAIPLLLWVVDSSYRASQRRFIWRSVRIMEFLNDERLRRSFEERGLVDFVVMDIASRRSQGPDYPQFTSMLHIMFFRTLFIFYVGLAVMSIVLWLAPKPQSAANSSSNRVPANTRLHPIAATS